MPAESRRRFLRLLPAAAGAVTAAVSRAAMGQKMNARTCLYCGEALGRYGFPDGHPLGEDRQAAFLKEAASRGLDKEVSIAPPRRAARAEIERFHTRNYVERVQHAEARAIEFLDNGDTPVFPGVYEAAATVVGSALDGLSRIMTAEYSRSFQPIGGLHHARRDGAAGFCVFNDLGVVIDTLRSEYGVQRVAYVDIDVHHGDGVFYAYEGDPDLIFADIHEDGHYLYPGTGAAHETGRGKAKGTKLNIPLAPGDGDEAFSAAWPRVLAHLRRFEPQFLLLQCGADGLEGDPLAHLRYSSQVHALVTRSLCHLAGEYAAGRLMVFGGGGYDRNNLAQAWCAVLRELARA
jgi:acetoin utilization protein AcuC